MKTSLWEGTLILGGAVAYSPAAICREGGSCELTATNLSRSWKMGAKASGKGLGEPHNIQLKQTAMQLVTVE